MRMVVLSTTTSLVTTAITATIAVWLIREELALRPPIAIVDYGPIGTAVSLGESPDKIKPYFAEIKRRAKAYEAAGCYVLRLIVMRHLVKVAFAIGAMTTWPAMLVADEIDDAAVDGAGFAKTVFPDAVVDQDGNVSIGGQQDDLTLKELFPGADEGDTAAFTDIDTEDEAAAAGNRARGEGSDAIDVVDEANAQQRDDLSDDPFLDATDRTFNDVDALADEFGACSTTREIVPIENTALLPEQRFCERIRKVEGACTINHQLSIDAASGTVLIDEWGPPDCMIAASHVVGPSVCTGTVTVTEGAALDECLEIDGIIICPGDPIYEQLSPPPFDGKEQRISRLALTIDIGSLDCEANLPALPCTTTSTGDEICPADQGDIIDTCDGLRSDPVCRFIDQACVPGAEVDGVCYLEELRFECDEEIAYQTYHQQTSLTCPVADIRCNGNDASTSIARAIMARAEAWLP
ncbi:MAG: hypothetical protein HC871_04530 [Rhizobiales bacterium]|nr:hypothetical protein [Hyphomicrobiales bacterium]